jgi:ABC-type polysaccharide/polyol phosphate transport system ATPase subunit
MKPAIMLRDVTKIFRTYHHYHAGFKAFVLNPKHFLVSGSKDALLAVDGVSLTIYEGETFGILGRNGAGKSTLLALVGGILRPTSGEISVRGRLSALLGLGAGFSYDLTGRENIILNGVLLGLRKTDIERKSNQIIEWSGLADSIDQPLKTYSSGMQMRLGFSIAVHVQPEILLVDEVLAVGDAEFHAKCLKHITDLRRQGVTIVFVSHDLQAISSMCDRAAWIEKGRLSDVGSPADVTGKYRRAVGVTSAPARTISAPTERARIENH